jgi:hypothetical protein
MNDEITPGTERIIDGRLRIYYDGYWIKAYEVPPDTLLAKKRLIEALTRRLFNHVEYGLNVPGTRLEEARKAYDGESDPARKRVKGAMLAGALFNRAADIFTKLVELQALGVVIQPDNALMRQCGSHLGEALELGKMVLHRSGDEGIDELWGEPFKAFAYPIHEFYRTRYVKIALAMREIDEIAAALTASFGGPAAFAGITPLIDAFAAAAKLKCETLRTDADVFEVWASFVVASEKLAAFETGTLAAASDAERETLEEGRRLLKRGRELLLCIARARVPMPKSARELLTALSDYQDVRSKPRRSQPRTLAADPDRGLNPHHA